MQPALCNRAYVLLCVFVRKAAAALVTVSAGDRQLLDSDRETFSLHLSLSLSALRMCALILSVCPI